MASRAASTISYIYISESPHWRRGFVTLWGPFLIDQPCMMLAPGHFGCGLGCGGFADTLPALQTAGAGAAQQFHRTP